MCLAELGTVVEVLDVGRAIVRFSGGATRAVSLAVLVAEGCSVAPGDTVLVSIGMALRSGAELDSEAACEEVGG